MKNDFFRQQINFKLSPKLTRITERLEKYEWYALGIYFITLLLLATRLTFFANLYVGVASSLAVLYFYTGLMEVPEMEKQRRAIFFQKLAGLGAAVTLVGLQFSAMGWAGNKSMLLGGMSSCLVFLVSHPFLPIPDPAFQKKVRIKALRSFVLVLLCSVYYFTPEKTLIESGLMRDVKTHKEQVSDSPSTGH